MSKQWTDEDVARMLGWPVGQNEYYVDNRATNMLHFGLSTPPSAEADANAARYVLPWLRERGASVTMECEQEWDVSVSFREDALDLCLINGELSTALCTAALEAYHAGTPVV
jgi:hypothetical protein